MVCARRGKSQGDTFRLLQEVYGDLSVSCLTCRHWYVRGFVGETSVEDRPCPGPTLSARQPERIDAMQQLLDKDRHATVRQIAHGVQVSCGTAHRILKIDLKLKKKTPKFVPKVLSQEQKDLRVEICHENLKKCEDVLFFWNIVTGDESWFSVREPEMKSQSLQWLQLGAPHPKKVIRNKCDKKTMLIAFFDDQGIVHVEFVPPKMTVTSNFYCGVLARLQENIRRKRPVLWQDNSYLLLHDNAPGHKAAHTITAMAETDMNSV